MRRIEIRPGFYRDSVSLMQVSQRAGVGIDGALVAMATPLNIELAEQMGFILPPTSTNDLILGLSLADQIRITFSDMKPATICERFPDIDLATKRRYRCVAEYLIRQGELAKVKDANGKLIKKVGNMQKMVVIYQPLPKIRQTLQRSGLSEFIKNDQSSQEIDGQTAAVGANAD